MRCLQIAQIPQPLLDGFHVLLRKDILRGFFRCYGFGFKFVEDLLHNVSDIFVNQREFGLWEPLLDSFSKRLREAKCDALCLRFAALFC